MLMDVLLYIAEPQTMGPRVLEILRRFEAAAGLRVNKNKSIVVPLRGDWDDIVWSEGIPIRRVSFKYLGMTISRLPEMA